MSRPLVSLTSGDNQCVVDGLSFAEGNGQLTVGGLDDLDDAFADAPLDDDDAASTLDAAATSAAAAMDFPKEFEVVELSQDQIVNCDPGQIIKYSADQEGSSQGSG